MKTFEEYLQWLYGMVYSDDVLDDDMPDTYERWLETLDTEQIISFAEAWGKTLTHQK